MRHDPKNTNCDKVRYEGAEDVLCSCDEDTPAPSTVLAEVHTNDISTAGCVLRGREAQLYAEFRAASQQLDIARRQLEPAQARYRAALEALSNEACSR